MKIYNIKKYLVCIFSHFIPRNKNIWITGKIASWEYKNNPPMFFDNSKYFYLYLVNKTNEKVFWLSSSKEEIELLNKMGLPVVRFNTPKGIWLTLRAKYFFHHYGINQIDRILQFGSTQINFWHGTPIKKIGYDVIPKLNKKANVLAAFLDKDGKQYISSTSSYLSQTILEHAFDINDSQMLNFGYPRTDILGFNKEEILGFCNLYASNLVEYFKLAKGKKVYLYMPTFRDDDPDYFSKANINFLRLNQVMENTNSLFFLKLHPLTSDINIKSYKNVIQIKNDVDIYPFLSIVNYLITDYSSIMFDFLPLDREIIFIPYDYNNYIKNRDLYFDYFDFIPGKVYSDFESFIEKIEDIETINYSDKRKKVKDLFIQDYHFDACEKTYKFFKETK